jgi:hypothetical protein
LLNTTFCGILFFMSNAEWLDRPEPPRVPIDEFGFKQRSSQRELYQMAARSAGGQCLAKQIKEKGSLGLAATSYGGERINEDGAAEQLVGCRLCGAMCTITYNIDLRSALNESNQRERVSIAEAPQPNPWDELGTFDDCKAGDVSVPTEATNLTNPVGLDYEQRAIFKLLRGHTD